MPIVQPPKVVQNAVDGFLAPLFKNKPERGYIGDLKFNRKITFKGVERQAVEFAKTIPPGDRKPVTVDGVKQWYLSVCVKMPNIDHKVRVVIL